MSLLAELSHDAALRALDLQERGLSELRQRTGTLLAASSITASFLGAQTIQHTATLGVLEGTALTGLFVSIGAAIYVLLPKRDFVFSVNAIAQFEALFEVIDDDEEVRRRLIYWLEGLWSGNPREDRGAQPLLLHRRGRPRTAADLLDLGARR